jgi:hypothetical protein
VVKVQRPSAETEIRQDLGLLERFAEKAAGNPGHLFCETQKLRVRLRPRPVAVFPARPSDPLPRGHGRVEPYEPRGVCLIEFGDIFS